MGKVVSTLKEPLIYASNVTKLIAGRKRKRDDDNSTEDISNAIGKSLQEPKRKKLLTTTQYIYQALFKEEKNSDVAVLAIGKVWNLHKVYLCQSPYFSSMFNGSWRESGEDFIHIKILDPKITVESLEKVFGSFYADEIVIEPVNVVSVLATATVFQLESIIEKCAEVMLETTNAETAVVYYEAACQYGVKSVKNASFNWLLVNLLSVYSKHVKWLRPISFTLMAELVTSPELYVMQTEYSLYALLRLWMYLKIFPDFDPESKTSEENGSNDTYFTKRTDSTPFLHTTAGMQFEAIFKTLRLQHLLINHNDMKSIFNDNIIPKEWLHSYLLGHWTSILKIDNAEEQVLKDVTEDVFYKNCMRCGRVLPEPAFQKWRWTGFNFGLDLVLTVEGRLLSIRRHHKSENKKLLSYQLKRQFMIRVIVASLNNQRQVVHSQSTGIKTLTLEKNEESTLMLFESKLEYPLLVSVNLLIVSPNFNTLSISKKDNAASPNLVNISEIGANTGSPGSANSGSQDESYSLSDAPDG